jgi:hypothetical protein
VYDQTNRGSGQDVLYMSGTDRGSARLYIQPDTTQPFLVDTNADGICDSLAREDFKYESLNPVGKTGSLQYSKTDFATAPAVNPTGGVCALKDPVTPPTQLCMEASDMTVLRVHRFKVRPSRLHVQKRCLADAGRLDLSGDARLGLARERRDLAAAAHLLRRS